MTVRAGGPLVLLGCLLGGDVFDTRRLARLRNAAGEGHEVESEAAPYPQQMFGDLDEARRWLASLV